MIKKNYVQGSHAEGEWLSTVYILVLTSLDQLLLILKIVFTFVTKLAFQFLFPASTDF